MSSSVVGGPLLAGDRVGVLAAAVDGLAGRPAGVLTEAELVGELAGIRAQIGRLEALCAERLAAADRRGVAAAAGAVSTQAWYRRVGQLPPGQAGAAVRRARALAADLPGLRAAGIEGRVCWAKLRIAAGQAAAAPAHLLGVVEPALLAAAGELDVRAVRAGLPGRPGTRRGAARHGPGRPGLPAALPAGVPGRGAGPDRRAAGPGRRRGAAHRPGRAEQPGHHPHPPQNRRHRHRSDWWGR